MKQDATYKQELFFFPLFIVVVVGGSIVSEVCTRCSYINFQLVPLTSESDLMKKLRKQIRTPGSPSKNFFNHYNSS